MRIAFATCAAVPDGYEDDLPAAALLDATYEVWNDPTVDWGRYDRVVLRSVWDYAQNVEAFLGWCRAVGGTRLRNPPDLVAWSADKTYLRDVAAPTVPTVFVTPGDAPPALDGEVVVKPNVSAGALDTGRFGPAAHDGALALIDRITASGRTALVQPYLADVDTHGETAMVHFGGALSHVLHKRAVLQPDEVAPVAAGELEVAAVMLEDDLVGPGTASDDELGLARRVMTDLHERFGAPPLYARVDVIRGLGGAPVLLELEAIEPALYLATAPGSAERFAAAVARS